MLKSFPLHWCLQYDWMWLNKTFIQVKLFICWIMWSIPFWCLLASIISNFSLSINLVLLSSILRISCHSGGNWMVVLKCALRLSFWTNFLSQWWQLNGFSPVWSHAGVNILPFFHKCFPYQPFKNQVILSQFSPKLPLIPNQLPQYYPFF